MLIGYKNIEIRHLIEVILIFYFMKDVLRLIFKNIEKFLNKSRKFVDSAQ
uniref:Uncharacterized protein n=1 Tax=Physcomitrium patens TaxID=3218 RepID=A0A2K1JTE6_PHYPA|nr:hypothetical protein PHYPA_014584 [Physcomitrium patens]